MSVNLRRAANQRGIRRTARGYSRVGSLPYALRILAGHARTGQVALACTKGLQLDILGKTPALISHRRFAGLRSAVDAATQGSSERQLGTAAPTGTALLERGPLDTNRFTSFVGTTNSPYNRVYGITVRFFAPFNNYDYGPLRVIHGKITNTAGTLDIAAADVIYEVVMRPGILPSKASFLSVANAGNAFNVATGDFGSQLSSSGVTSAPGWKIQSCNNANLLVDVQTQNQKDLSSIQQCGMEMKDAEELLDWDDVGLAELLDEDFFPGIN